MNHLAKLQALLLVGLVAACVLPAQAQLANNLTIGNPKSVFVFGKARASVSGVV